MIRRHKLSDEDSERLARQFGAASAKPHKTSPFDVVEPLDAERKTQSENAKATFEVIYEDREESEKSGTEVVFAEKADDAEATENVVRGEPEEGKSADISADGAEYVKEFNANDAEFPGDLIEGETEDEHVAREFVDTLRLNKEKKRRTIRKSRQTIIRRLLLLLSIAAFLVSIYMITKQVFSGMKAKQEYDDLQQSFFDGITRSSNTVLPASRMAADIPTPPYGSERIELDTSVRIPTKTNAQFKQYQAKLASYKIENPDTYGWIQVDGTNINYVVVKGSDNVYYLDHTYTGFYNPLGAIFADFRNGDNMLDNYNTVFYGHNATYQNQMFNQLTNLLSRDSFENNRYITVYTTYGILTYEIFSIYETDIAFDYYRIYFNNGYSFISWANAVRDQSMFIRDGMAPFTASDRVLTLSTCTNGVNTRRYAVHARLVSVEVD